MLSIAAIIDPAARYTADLVWGMITVSPSIGALENDVSALSNNLCNNCKCLSSVCEKEEFVDQLLMELHENNYLLASIY
jgi:hypothetical protein